MSPRIRVLVLFRHSVNQAQCQRQFTVTATVNAGHQALHNAAGYLWIFRQLLNVANVLFGQILDTLFRVTMHIIGHNVGLVRKLVIEGVRVNAGNVDMFAGPAAINQIVRQEHCFRAKYVPGRARRCPALLAT
jgi:hypothetical protein